MSRGRNASALLGARVMVQGAGATAAEEPGTVVRVVGRWTVLVELASGLTVPATMWGSEQKEGEL